PPPPPLDHLSMELLDDLRSERPRNLQNRLRVGYVAGIDAREHAIDQIGAHLAFQVVVAPVEQMLQNQHADDDLGWRPRPPASPALRPASFESSSDDLNHGPVLQQGCGLVAP